VTDEKSELQNLLNDIESAEEEDCESCKL